MDAELWAIPVAEPSRPYLAPQAAIDKNLIRDGAFARLFVVIFGT